MQANTQTSNQTHNGNNGAQGTTPEHKVGAGSIPSANPPAKPAKPATKVAKPAKPAKVKATEAASPMVEYQNERDDEISMAEATDVIATALTAVSQGDVKAVLSSLRRNMLKHALADKLTGTLRQALYAPSRKDLVG